MPRLFFLLVLFTLPSLAQQQDWTAVEESLGRACTLLTGVCKVSFPRNDLQVRVGETELEPAAALGTWMAFRRDRSGVVADGDLVVTAEELGPVTSALVESGLEISAIHNHIAGDRPAVYYVHFFFQGGL